MTSVNLLEYCFSPVQYFNGSLSWSRIVLRCSSIGIKWSNTLTKRVVAVTRQDVSSRLMPYSSHFVRSTGVWRTGVSHCEQENWFSCLHWTYQRQSDATPVHKIHDHKDASNTEHDGSIDWVFVFWASFRGIWCEWFSPIQDPLHCPLNKNEYNEG